MAKLTILKAPHPFLRKTAKPVEAVDKATKKLIADMFETMYDADGIGLAATQVGVDKRILVLDVAQKNSGSKPMAFINPEIIKSSEETNDYDEGCLSFPGQYSTVTRPKQVTIKYLDKNGTPQQIEADELLATCLQHEIDHLNGKVFVDHISRIKRDIIMRKLKKLQ